MDGLTAGERREYRKTLQAAGFTVYLSPHYGAGELKLVSRSTGLPVISRELDDTTALKTLKKNEQKAEAYGKNLEAMTSEASRKLADLKKLQKARPTGRYDENGSFVDVETGRPLDPKKANSPEFMAMVNSLEALSRLNSGNTPAQIEQAAARLDQAAKQYETKINNQTGAGFWSGNGRSRVRMSRDLQEFTSRHIAALTGDERSRLAANEPLKSQAERAKTNVAEYEERIRLKEAGQNQAGIQNAGQGPAGGAAGAANPEEKPVKYWNRFEEFMNHHAPGENRERSKSVHVRRHNQPQAGEQADMENAQGRNSVKNRSVTGP